MQAYLNHNNHVLLVFKEGRKWATAVALDKSVRLVRFDKHDLPTMRPAMYRDKPYPVSRAVRKFKAIGKVLGITTAAKKVLRSGGSI